MECTCVHNVVGALYKCLWWRWWWWMAFVPK